MTPMQEFVDILDANGRSLAKAKPRDQVHRDGDWHRTVHVWVVNSRGDVLLQKRAAHKESHPGKWDISAAGHIEAGAAPLEAALREVAEELGLAVNPSSLRHIFIVRGEYHEPASGFLDREFSDVFLLKTDVPADQFRMQESEVEALRFVPAAELRDMVGRGDPSLVPHEEEYGRLLGILGDVNGDS